MENGVGMLRLQEEEFAEALAEIKKSGYVLSRERHVTVATGRLAASYMEAMAKQLMVAFEGLKIEVCSIRNDFFGELITVSGLLTGKDIYEQLKDRELFDELVLPYDDIVVRKDIKEIDFGKFENFSTLFNSVYCSLNTHN